jgi:hypothetical protein
MACELDLPESLPGMTIQKTGPWANPPSNCWRGYVGYWEIANNRLSLQKVVGGIQGRFRPPLFAEWFSGVVRVPQGEYLGYSDYEYGGVHETDLFLEIENGIVIRRWTQKNRTKDECAEALKNFERQFAEDLLRPEPPRYLP